MWFAFLALPFLSPMIRVLVNLLWMCPRRTFPEFFASLLDPQKPFGVYLGKKWTRRISSIWVKRRAAIR